MTTGSAPSPVVDTHAHFWRWPEGPEGERARRVAAQASAAYAHPPLAPEELLAEMDRAGVDRLVQVTRTAMGFDNGYSLEGAAAHPDRIRVLVRFDPFGPDVAQRLRDVLAHPHVVGVRVHHFPPDDEWLLDGTYDPVWTGLEEAGQVASIYAPGRPDQLAEIARRHPGLTVVADHVAVDVVPDSDPGTRFDCWEGVLAMAEQPKIAVKVSGLPEATEEGAPFPLARERVRDLVGAFGADRLMWGSNYPPTARVCSYGDSVELVRSACDFLDDHARDLVLGGTACRLLGLPWGIDDTSAVGR